MVLGFMLSKRVWISVLVLLVSPGVPAHAQTALTVNQSTQLQAYLNQGLGTPVRTPSDTQDEINRAVMQAVSSLTPEQLAESTAGPVNPVRKKVELVREAAASGTPDETAPIKKVKTKGMLAILDLGAPDAGTASITYGLAAGQGAAPAVPASANFDHETAVAVLAAFKAPIGQKTDQTAESAATYAAAPVLDPAMEERVDLARAVYRIDGTDALIRHFIATQHMKLIIEEVARHIDFSKLSDSDKYRLAAIAAVAQTELEEKVIRMNALVQAQTLSKPELLQLLAAYDNDTQRKLTDMRLHDDGKVDRAAELDIRLAQFQIVKAFEAGQ
jgi:hypothetical protein